MGAQLKEIKFIMTGWYSRHHSGWPPSIHCQSSLPTSYLKVKRASCSPSQPLLYLTQSWPMRWELVSWGVWWGCGAVGGYFFDKGRETWQEIFLTCSDVDVWRWSARGCFSREAASQRIKSQMLRMEEQRTNTAWLPENTTEPQNQRWDC